MHRARKAFFFAFLAADGQTDRTQMPERLSGAVRQVAIPSVWKHCRFVDHHLRPIARHQTIWIVRIRPRRWHVDEPISPQMHHGDAARNAEALRTIRTAAGCEA